MLAITLKRKRIKVAKWRTPKKYLKKNIDHLYRICHGIIKSLKLKLKTSNHFSIRAKDLESAITLATNPKMDYLIDISHTKTN
jgi:hypothetical protein